MKRDALFAALDEELRFQMGGAPGAWVEALTHIFAVLEERGLQLVPKVPTDEMKKAGGDRIFSVYGGYDAETKRNMRMFSGADLKAESVWSGMLAASKGAQP